MVGHLSASIEVMVAGAVHHVLGRLVKDGHYLLEHPELKASPRLALVMGTEGDGLPAETIACTTFTVKIPMAHNVDSLNVAAASAVAFWELRV